jgi:hypothetical protein
LAIERAGKFLQWFVFKSSITSDVSAKVISFSLPGQVFPGKPGYDYFLLQATSEPLFGGPFITILFINGLGDFRTKFQMAALKSRFPME